MPLQALRCGGARLVGPLRPCTCTARTSERLRRSRAATWRVEPSPFPTHKYSYLLPFTPAYPLTYLPPPWIIVYTSVFAPIYVLRGICYIVLYSGFVRDKARVACYDSGCASQAARRRQEQEAALRALSGPETILALLQLLLRGFLKSHTFRYFIHTLACTFKTHRVVTLRSETATFYFRFSFEC